MICDGGGWGLFFFLNEKLNKGGGCKPRELEERIGSQNIFENNN